MARDWVQSPAANDSVSHAFVGKSPNGFGELLGWMNMWKCKEGAVPGGAMEAHSPFAHALPTASLPTGRS